MINTVNSIESDDLEVMSRDPTKGRRDVFKKIMSRVPDPQDQNCQKGWVKLLGHFSPSNRDY